MVGNRKSVPARLAEAARRRTLSALVKVVSAAIAAAVTASISYGHYTVTAGQDGSGLMPPSGVLYPDDRG